MRQCPVCGIFYEGPVCPNCSVRNKKTTKKK